MNHIFPTFQHLIDRAIMKEKKHKEMEDHKCKIGGPQPGSSNLRQPTSVVQAELAPASTAVSEAVPSASVVVSPE
jgi:hypothetical protein